MSESISLTSIISQPAEARAERRDAAENREQIVCTAAKLFSEHGVDSVTMADIAKAAGVGKGTLYRRFSHKGELCLSLLDEKLRHFQNERIEDFNQMIRDQVGYLSQLDHFLHHLIQFILKNLDLMIEIDRVSVAGLVQDINTPHFWMEMTIRRLLEKAIEYGEVLPGLDIPYFTSVLLSPLDGRILRGHLEIKGYTADRIEQGLRQIILSQKI